MKKKIVGMRKMPSNRMGDIAQGLGAVALGGGVAAGVGVSQRKLNKKMSQAVEGLANYGEKVIKKNKKKKSKKDKKIEEGWERFMNQSKSLQQIKKEAKTDPKIKALYGDWLSSMD